MLVGNKIVLLALMLVWGVVALRVTTELRRAGDPLRHHDFRTLASHQELFYRGIYPHAAVEAAPAGERYADSVYPPYAFVMAMPWLPPALGRDARELWFTGCQLGAIGVLLFFMWKIGREVDRTLAWLMIGAVLGMTGLWADVHFGNFSALACAPVAGLYFAQRSDRRFLAGLAWCGAMLKPQVGTMFFALLLGKREWRGFACGVGLLVVATIAACGWTGVSVREALSGIYLRGLLELAPDGHSIVTVLSWLGVSPGLAQPIAGMAGVVTLWILLGGPLRQAELMARVAAVALVARLCLYHRPCDDLLLVFPLGFLGREAWIGNGCAAWAAPVLAASAWLPTRLTELPPVKLLVVAIWIIVVPLLVGVSKHARSRATQ